MADNLRSDKLAPGDFAQSLEGRGLDRLDARDLQEFRICRKLSVARNRLTSLQAIQLACKDLEYLVADDNLVAKFSEIQRLAGLKHLVSLSLVRNPITETEGYRSYVAILLPYLQVLDGSPVTLEERTAAATSTRRNFGTMPTLIENKTSINLFQSMLGTLNAQMEDAFASEATLSQMKRIDYKSLWKAASNDLQHSLGEQRDVWAVELIEDVEIIAEDLLASSDGLDFVMDRAFLQLLQLQLGRIQELKDRVDALITDRNALVDLLAKDPSLLSHCWANRRAPISRQIVKPEVQLSPKLRERETELVKLKAIDKVQQFRENIPQKMTQYVDGQNRVDDLLMECQAKDAQIGAFVGANLSREADIRQLDDIASDLKKKLTDFKKLEHLREKIKIDVVKKSAEIGSYDHLIVEAQQVETQIEKIKDEIAELKEGICECLERETNQESAEELRRYHLKVKLFAWMQQNLQNKRIESVVDSFRDHHLQRKLFQSWKSSNIEKKKLVLIADRLQISASPDWTDEDLEREIVCKFKQNRKLKWLAFFCQVLENHKEQELQKESLRTMAQKFYANKLQAKAIFGLKKEHSLSLGGDRVSERHYLLAVQPVVERNRLKAALNAWIHIFKNELKPLYDKKKLIEKMRNHRIKTSILSSFHLHARKSKEELKALQSRHQNYLLKGYLSEWKKTFSLNLSRRRWIDRRIACFKLTQAFRFLKVAIRHQQKASKDEVLNENRGETENEPAENILEVSSTRKTEELFKEVPVEIKCFRHRWQQKKRLELLKKISDEQIAAESGKIAEDSEITKNEVKDLRETSLSSSPAKDIEDRILEFRKKSKLAKKVMLLAYWKKAGNMLKIQREKTKIISHFVLQNQLRRAIRGFKLNRLEGLRKQIYDKEKVILVQQERGRQDALHATMALHESESIFQEISHLASIHNQKQIELEASVSNNHKLRECISSTALAAEHALQGVVEIENSNEKELNTQSDHLEDRKLKAQALEKDLSELLAEVQVLDARIESSL